MATDVPLSAHTVYQDLLQALLDCQVSEFVGKPLLREISGKHYWYAKSRLGDRVIQRYVGRDTPELRIRLAERQTIRRNEKAASERRSLQVAQLRAAQMPTPDRATARIVDALAKVGVFRLGGTLVGTHAFRLYDAELGARVTDEATAVTEDIDIAAFERLSLVLGDKVDPSLGETFRDLRLEPVPMLDRKGRTYRWRMEDGGAMVDILTPSFSEEEKLRKLESLGVWAQSLHFLNFLIADPIPAAMLYRSGVLVQIPRPERYAVHKLIVSQRRHGVANPKVKKDLLQADALIRTLAEDRPGELRLAYQTARDNGPSWRTALDSALAMRPAIASHIAALT
jgi:hypothetical protein